MSFKYIKNDQKQFINKKKDHVDLKRDIITSFKYKLYNLSKLQDTQCPNYFKVFDWHHYVTVLIRCCIEFAKLGQSHQLRTFF